ncbi:hypothetical protein HDU96_003358, partial [Phlyctochytrium bullatum]
RYLASSPLTAEQVTSYRTHLHALLLARCSSSSWDPHRPLRGSAYRAVLCSPKGIDAVLVKAAERAGCERETVEKCFGGSNAELVLWIDPGCVSYRAGHDHGPIMTLWEDPASTPRYSQPSMHTHNHHYTNTNAYTASSSSYAPYSSSPSHIHLGASSFASSTPSSFGTSTSAIPRTSSVSPTPSSLPSPPLPATSAAYLSSPAPSSTTPTLPASSILASTPGLVSFPQKTKVVLRMPDGASVIDAYQAQQQQQAQTNQPSGVVGSAQRTRTAAQQPRGAAIVVN